MQESSNLRAKVFKILAILLGCYMLVFSLGFSTIFLEIFRDLAAAIGLELEWLPGFITTLTFAEMQHEAMFVAGITALIFLKYSGKSLTGTPQYKEKMPIYNIILAIAVAASSLYIFFVYRSLFLRQGLVEPQDIIFGTILIILIVEAGRRCVGLALMLLTVVFLIYGFWDSNFDLSNYVSMMYLYNIGLWGIPTWVAAFYIYFFMFFSAVLTQIGLGDYFITSATSIAGDRRGGPAKVAIFSSAGLGMMTGSATGNVLTTGSFTIPLMKKTGYTAESAAAIESAASTGGQIMPPVLGSASFIMAVFLGMKYINISIAAIIPAILYFFGLYWFVDVEARKAGLKGLLKEGLPPKIDIIKRAYYLIPILILVVVLVEGFPAQYAAISGMAAALIVEWITRKENPLRHKIGFLILASLCIVSLILLGLDIYGVLIMMGIMTVFLTAFYGWFVKNVRRMFHLIIDALAGSISQILGVAIACIMAGLIQGVLMYTGLTLTLADVLIDISGGNVVILLLLAMVAALILGMGMPTPAVYVVTAITIAPALVRLGIPPLAAHFFLFFFGIMGPLTPPVAVTAFAGAALAGADFWKTGIKAFRAAIVAVIVPFLFVAKPELLLVTVETWDLATIMRVLFYFVMGLIGVVFTVGCLGNYFMDKLTVIRRIIFGAGAILSITAIVVNAYLAIPVVAYLGYEIVKSRWLQKRSA